LENTAEGFVQLIEDEKDLAVWEPDLEILQFKNNQTGETLTVGQKLRVKLKSVDEDMLRLNFELV
jgi:exoribonuclease R